jgi:hypothetical protein
MGEFGKLKEDDLNRLFELTDNEGRFKPTIPRNVNGAVTISYLNELAEWLYLRPDMSIGEKYSSIILIEKHIKQGLVMLFPDGKLPSFIPIWSQMTRAYM